LISGARSSLVICSHISCGSLLGSSEFVTHHSPLRQSQTSRHCIYRYRHDGQRIRGHFLAVLSITDIELIATTSYRQISCTTRVYEYCI